MLSRLVLRGRLCKMAAHGDGGESMKYYVEPFRGANYLLWKRRVEAIFAAKDMDKFLTGDKSDDANKKKAYALLISMIDDSILAAMSDETSAFKIWEALKNKYGQSSAVSQILVRKKLTSMKKRRDCSMQNHINEILGMVNEQASGTTVNEELLMSLPPEYDVIKSTIENQSDTTLTSDFVIQRLLNAEALKSDTSEKKAENAKTNVAFNAEKYQNVTCHKCKQKGHIAKYCSRKSTCHNCGRPGHLKKDCRVKSKSNNNESTAVTFMVNESSERFMLDSGASTHMCSKQEWFKEMRPHRRTVTCASKVEVLEVKGIGKIVGMLNGREITLTEVLYISELNGQLISVKNIQKAGYSVIFTNNVAIK